MGLVFSGSTARTESGVSVEAQDTATAMPVPVNLSAEAVRVFGLDAAKDKAEEKYDSGKTETGGGVWVRIEDF